MTERPLTKNDIKTTACSCKINQLDMIDRKDFLSALAWAEKDLDKEAAYWQKKRISYEDVDDDEKSYCQGMVHGFTLAKRSLHKAFGKVKQ